MNKRVHGRVSKPHPLARLNTARFRAEPFNDPHPVVASLVKIQTGLSQVSAASYLKQAEEIFANGNVATEGVSHPEAFIRARALALWQEQRSDSTEQISAMIEGAATLEELDLIGQRRLTVATRRLLQCLLRPKWFQTPATLGHAKLFFDDFQPAKDQHAVAPAWTKILKELAHQHETQAAFDASCETARKEWRTEDAQEFRALVDELRTDRLANHASVKALIRQLADSADAAALIENLVGIHERFAELDSTLRSLLAEHTQFDFPELTQVLAKLREETSVLAELSPILSELVELPEPFSLALRRTEIPLDEFEAAVGHKSLNQVYRLDRGVNRFESRILTRKMEQLEKRYGEWLSLNARRIRAAVRKKFLEHVNISSLPASQLQPEQKPFKKSYAAGRRELEHEFGKTMRYKSIRDLAAGDTGKVIQDLKPIWLMSPLSVSDTLPLDPDLFDVVLFDEASQIPLEEAIPAIYRSHQVIVVGDEMQLPPTSFFASSRGEDGSVIVEEEGERIEVDLDSDSFLTQSATNLPSTLLAWHYRSRYESLISFSNAAFYGGNLFTIPDRQRLLAERPELRVTATAQGGANVEGLLARSISFHFVEHGLYQDRRNPNEAAYIAQLVRGLLGRETRLSIGVVAFSEAQQTE